METLLAVSLDDLFVPSTQVESNLGSLEPVLYCTFTLHESHVLLESLLFDSESLQNAQHLMHGIVSLSEPRALHSPIGSDYFSRLNFGHFIGLHHLTGLKLLLSHYKRLKHSLFGVFTPSEPSFSKVGVLETKEEFFGGLDSPVV